MSIKIDRLVAGQLVQELRAITQEANLDTLAIITETGSKIAFFSKTEADPMEMSAIGASVIGVGGLALTRIDFGTLTDVMIRGSNGFLILRKMGPFTLVGGTNNKEEFINATKVLLEHSVKLHEILKDVEYEE
jgi:predicted regulator of Ras-like GTPase activity (Roadblock/LC7/MglB family)